MVEGTTTGSHSHGLGEVRHHLVDVFLRQLLPAGLAYQSFCASAGVNVNGTFPAWRPRRDIAMDQIWRDSMNH